MVDEVPEEHSWGKGPSRVHSSTSVVHLKHKTLVTVLHFKLCTCIELPLFVNVSHPHEMSNGDREANGESSRSQTSISPLIGYGENAHHKLHSEENLHSSGHSKADARLKLEIQMDKKLNLWTQGEHIHIYSVGNIYYYIYVLFQINLLK